MQSIKTSVKLSVSKRGALVVIRNCQISHLNWKEFSNKVAHNGHGLAMWWNLKIVRPEPQPNKNTKDEANKQKPNRITSAETAADSDKMPMLTTSSHHIAKPNVEPNPPSSGNIHRTIDVI